MQITVSGFLNQFQRLLQGVLFPALQEQLGPLPDKHRQLAAVLSMIEIEALVGQPGIGAPSPGSLSRKRYSSRGVSGNRNPHVCRIQISAKRAALHRQLTPNRGKSASWTLTACAREFCKWLRLRQLSPHQRLTAKSAFILKRIVRQAFQPRTRFRCTGPGERGLSASPSFQSPRQVCSCSAGRPVPPARSTSTTAPCIRPDSPVSVPGG